MEFDITNLDKHLVIQTLFAHADALAIGQYEYDFRKRMGDNVDGLTDDECEIILAEFNDLDKGHVKLLDYHKGKPMKLYFEKKSNGRVPVDSGGYDSRNGKYRFFEALLNVFLLDEILITKKGYKQFTLLDLDEDQILPKEKEEMFKSILKNTIKMENDYGKYLAIDETKVIYTPPFMK